MAHRESPWHICHECLDPLAHDLYAIASRFRRPFDVAKADRLNVEFQQILEAARPTEAQRKQLDEQSDGLLKQMGAQTEPPRSFDVGTLYRKYDIKKAADWLKFYVSVEYGEDFERTLHEAKQRFYKLEFKTCQMINGDVGNETTIGVRYAIQRLMKRHNEELRSQFPDHEHRPEREELPDDLRAFEDDILDEYIEIEHQIQAAANYLQRVSLLVQGKMNASQATPNAAEGGGEQEADDAGKPDAPATSAEKQAKWLGMALLLLRDHPEWSDAEIARRVGKDRSTLCRSPEYQLATALARGSKVDLPQGHVTVDPESGQHDVEAYTDSGDPAKMDWD